MASAISHYRESEDLLAVEDELDESNTERRALVLARAQVHALLAVAGTNALQAYSDGSEAELEEWADTAGSGS